LRFCSSEPNHATGITKAVDQRPRGRKAWVDAANLFRNNLEIDIVTLPPHIPLGRNPIARPRLKNNPVGPSSFEKPSGYRALGTAFCRRCEYSVCKFAGDFLQFLLLLLSVKSIAIVKLQLLDWMD